MNPAIAGYTRETCRGCSWRFTDGEKCFVMEHFVALLQGRGFSDLQRWARDSWDLQFTAGIDLCPPLDLLFLFGQWSIIYPELLWKHLLCTTRMVSAEINMKQPNV